MLWLGAATTDVQGSRPVHDPPEPPVRPHYTGESAGRRRQHVYERRPTACRNEPEPSRNRAYMSDVTIGLENVEVFVRATTGAVLTSAVLVLALLVWETSEATMAGLQVVRQYSLVDVDKARALVLQALERKDFPSLPIGIPFEWKIGDLRFDAKAFRIDSSDHALLADALAAPNAVVETRPSTGGCFVPASLFFTSTDLSVGRPGSEPRTMLRAGGYTLWVGQDGVLFMNARHESVVVAFDAPLDRDACNRDIPQVLQTTLVMSIDHVGVQLAGRTITLK
jgi:hypothetical protein